jgi:hypothetical protein
MKKPMSDVVYSSMPSKESRIIFQSVLAKSPCSLASASSDHTFFIDQVTGASCFNFLLVSRNQEDIIMVRFAKCWSRECFVCVSVCGVKKV